MCDYEAHLSKGIQLVHAVQVCLREFIMLHVGEVFPEQNRLRLIVGQHFHLNLGRKGTSSSKDKKLNWTVEAR